MKILEGYVDHIIFRNDENGFAIAKLTGKEGETTVKGSMPALSEGIYIEAHGDYVETANYGTQFEVVSYIEVLPDDSQAIRKYLASGAVKGIGKVMADRIVDMFGDDTFRIMDDCPEELARVRGISKKKALQIAEYVAEGRSKRAAMTYLSRYAITMNLAVKIYDRYGDNIYGILKENPYKIAYDISGVGFKTCDKIAAEMGLAFDSPERIKCGILYVLDMAGSDGHTFLPEKILNIKVADLLGVPEENVFDMVRELAMEKRLRLVKKAEDTEVYSAHLYKTETQTAYMLRDLNIEKEIPGEHIERLIDAVTEREGITLAAMQREAVVQALKRGVLVITGGPGTGKTTAINTIINILEIEGNSYLLAAPTGRAAKRMSEATGRPASTIHRLLEFSGDPDEAPTVGRDSGSPLEAEYVVIDEMSMVDIYLFNLLLRAIMPGTTLILVGDVNQLPSVGPGKVLDHIIASGLFSVVKLNEIFRQARESDIVVNAHRINAGEDIRLDNDSKDFFFLERKDPETVINVMLDLIIRKIPSHMTVAPLEIQVLSPTKKGILGVESLNNILRDRLNPPDNSKGEFERGDGVVFREGDKVMQIKNDYQLEWKLRGKYNISIEEGTGVFNGDMGRIVLIDTFLSVITVEFDDGHEVDYSYKQMDELNHAYAVTVHKSQGSEYPVVLMPVLFGPKMLLNRNILYTAVTRAKSMVFLVGSRTVISQMIANNRQDERYCGFLDRLRESAEDII